MALPKHTRKRRKVHGVTVYALTRGQVLQLSEVTESGDQEAIEVQTIALGTNSSADQAAEYYRTAPAGQVNDVVLAILDLSGLGEDAGKGSSEG